MIVFRGKTDSISATATGNLSSAFLLTILNVDLISYYFWSLSNLSDVLRFSFLKRMAISIVI